jgi:hypothetical protein
VIVGAEPHAAENQNVEDNNSSFQAAAWWPDANGRIRLNQSATVA